MYQSELCRKEYRGRLVSQEVLFIGIGISFAYWWDTHRVIPQKLSWLTLG